MIFSFLRYLSPVKTQNKENIVLRIRFLGFVDAKGCEEKKQKMLVCGDMKQEL